MTGTRRESGSRERVLLRMATLFLAALGGCGALPAPPVATGAVEFQEMRFTLPAGQWERSPGSPPSSQVLFTLSQGGGRAQTLSIWRVSYPNNMYGLAPERHTTNMWNYEQYEKPRPSPWVGFERSMRTIAGKQYPIMTYRWHYPSASNPEAEAHGILLAYFPNDFRLRERFYIFQWTDLHPSGAKQQGWEWLDQVVASFTVGPIAVSPAKVTLANPKTGESVTCPPQEGMVTRMITREQAEQQRAWYAEFQKTHNRLPTPMEGCIKGHEIRGFVRKPE